MERTQIGSIIELNNHYEYGKWLRKHKQEKRVGYALLLFACAIIATYILCYF